MQQQRDVASVLQLMSETKLGIPADCSVCGMQIIFYLIISFLYHKIVKQQKINKNLPLFFIYCYFFQLSLILLHSGLHVHIFIFSISGWVYYQKSAHSYHYILCQIVLLRFNQQNTTMVQILLSLKRSRNLKQIRNIYSDLEILTAMYDTI